MGHPSSGRWHCLNDCSRRPKRRAGEESARQVGAALAGSEPLGDLPLIVLSVGQNQDLSAAYLEDQLAGHADLASLSTRGAGGTGLLGEPVAYRFSSGKYS